MNKKLILILICLTAFGTAFAQTDFTDSARQKATAGQFSSDSDNLDASDIFDVERTFFSAGYQPALTLGNENSMGNMTGFWAMPINDIMTVGIAGEYKMFADRAETSVLNGANGVNSSITLNENSAFNIRPVFKFGAFAFSYRIARSGNYNSDERNTTIVPSGTLSQTNGTYNSGTKWEHEIGFAWNTDMFKLYVPIGALINMNSINYADYDATGTPTKIENTLNKTDNSVVSLYINPEISFPVQIGPITQFQTGINFKSGIFAPGSVDNLTTYSGTSVDEAPYPTANKEEKTVTETKGQSHIEVGTYLQTTMEWKTWGDKITFIAEPTIGIDYEHLNQGERTTTVTITYSDPAIPAKETVYEPTMSTYNNIVTPYLEANIGTAILFTEWFEFRAGLHYKLNWANNTKTESYKLQEGGKLSEYSYAFTSQFEVYSGFGFILGEDFFIDVFIAAGNFIDEDNDAFQNVGNATANTFDLFDIRNYGVQLSYRF